MPSCYLPLVNIFDHVLGKSDDSSIQLLEASAVMLWRAQIKNCRKVHGGPHLGSLPPQRVAPWLPRKLLGPRLVDCGHEVGATCGCRCCSLGTDRVVFSAVAIVQLCDGGL